MHPKSNTISSLKYYKINVFQIEKSFFGDYQTILSITWTYGQELFLPTQNHATKSIENIVIKTKTS